MPSSRPPSIHHPFSATLAPSVADLFHFLNDFGPFIPSFFLPPLLLQSLYSHSRTPNLGLWLALCIVTGEMKAREISSSYKRSEAFSQSERRREKKKTIKYINIFPSLSEASTDGREKATGRRRSEPLFEDHLGFSFIQTESWLLFFSRLRSDEAPRRAYICCASRRLCSPQPAKHTSPSAACGDGSDGLIRCDVPVGKRTAQEEEFRNFER